MMGIDERRSMMTVAGAKAPKIHVIGECGKAALVVGCAWHLTTLHFGQLQSNSVVSALCSNSNQVLFTFVVVELETSPAQTDRSFPISWGSVVPFCMEYFPKENYL